MRRRVFVLGALLALVVCGVAYAASSPDKVTATLKAPANGSAKKPAATSVSEAFSIKNKTAGDNAYPATNITTKIGNVKAVNAASDPKCTPAQITAAGSAKWNKVCKSGSLVATGKVNATLYTAKQTSSTGATCKLTVDVYNAGTGKLTYVLDTTPSACNGLTSSDAQPWSATYKQAGKTLDMNIPLPADVSTNAGGIGLWSAINSETINFSKKVNGKPFIESTGCTKDKRSYEYGFTVSNGSSKTTTDVKGTSKC